MFVEVGELVCGVIVYVMFEFCFYFGKMLFCVDVLVVVGVLCVVVVVSDLDLCVSGNGICRLCEVGIMVEIGLMEEVV